MHRHFDGEDAPNAVAGGGRPNEARFEDVNARYPDLFVTDAAAGHGLWTIGATDFWPQRTRFILRRPLRFKQMDDPRRQTSYFNYFTEIEDHFRQRRGTTLFLSTVDWALMDLWKESGVPLEAVLRGIDVTFDRYAARRSKTRKINGLGFCTQEVLAAAEAMKEAAVGARKPGRDNLADSAFRVTEIAGFLRRNATALEIARLPEAKDLSPRPLARETAEMLRAIAGQLDQAETLPSLEDLERRLTVAEEKLFAVLLAVIPDDEIVAERAAADHALAPYCRKMPAAQIEQLQKQYVRKRFLDKFGLPRLSLFYL
jgi:hypothetical protein